MEITQDKIDLIAKVIKNDRKFSGNEDLYDDFLNEACHRSLTIVNAIENEATLEAYLKKVVTTSIINVLKDSGRLRRTRSGYTPTKEYSIEASMPSAVTEAPTVSVIDKIGYEPYVVDYVSVNIPVGPEENAIQSEVLDFVADTLEDIDKQYPDKNYMQLFNLRYDKGMTQKEIASELGISQSEVSKRLYNLIDKMINILDN